MKTCWSLLSVLAIALLLAPASQAQYAIYNGGNTHGDWTCAGANGASVVAQSYYLQVSSLLNNGRLQCTKNSGYYTTSSYNTLWVMVQNADTFGSAGDILVRLYNASGTEISYAQSVNSYYGATLMTNIWLDPWMPLSKWSGSASQVSKVVIEFTNPSTIHVASIQFQNTDIPDPEHIYAFRESLFSGWSNSETNAYVNMATCQGGTPCGQFEIGLLFTGTNGKLELAKSGTAINTAGYDSLYFTATYLNWYYVTQDTANLQVGVVKSGDTDGVPDVFQYVNLHCNDTYDLPGSWPSTGIGGYCLARIPMTMLGAEDATITKIVFKNTVATNAFVYLNDIRFESGWSTGGYMRFPLKTSYTGTTLTPYNTRTTAIQDHCVPEMVCQTNYAGRIIAYNGQTGLASAGSTPASGVYGYRKNANGDAFDLPLLTYEDEVQGNYLFYEDGSGVGHTGYDYAPNTPESVNGKGVQAAEHGILCVATSSTTSEGLWRQNNHCPLYGISGSGWTDYHAVYIIHDKARNGSDATTDFSGCSTSWHYKPYISVYLHMSALDSTLQSAIQANGYVRVKRGQNIGTVGGYPNYAPHLHFGFRHGCERSDPYGPGSEGSTSGSIPSNFRVLWEVQP